MSCRADSHAVGLLLGFGDGLFLFAVVYAVNALDDAGGDVGQVRVNALDVPKERGNGRKAFLLRGFIHASFSLGSPSPSPAKSLVQRFGLYAKLELVIAAGVTAISA